MVSVLCDGPFFDGDYDHLQKARAGCRLPLLCKEFIIDEAQLDAAAAFGASAVLLIVRCLDEARLSTLISEAKKRSLVPLVEVFRAKEAQLALGCGADFIGVNSRDLDTLEMDTEEATRVLRSLPGHICAVHLSGVKTPADVSNIRSTRADAALIGEVLMKQEDPTELLRSLARVV